MSRARLEKMEYVFFLKNVLRGRIREYAEKYPNAEYHAGKRPWSVKCDIALPCATQNEINGEEAKELLNSESIGRELNPHKNGWGKKHHI